MQTEKLRGSILDYWVARALGLEPEPSFTLHWTLRDDPETTSVVLAVKTADGGTELFQPTRGEAAADVVFAAFDIEVVCDVAPGGLPYIMAAVPHKIGGPLSKGPGYFLGDDVYEAAMRAVVASKFGYEVPKLS
ncbi:hypothetical protein ACSFBX_34805 [Variovorax sp. RB2P76]|uniref:hypothetical protein n=1 Tax=Variovorax sp. RB2P76 TaxID=3443736 RepID=UPI003F476068